VEIKKQVERKSLIIFYASGGSEVRILSQFVKIMKICNYFKLEIHKKISFNV